MAWHNTPNGNSNDQTPGTFQATTQSESNYGGTPSVTVSTVMSSRSTTIADVRNMHGGALGLGGDHQAWVNGASVGDDFVPSVGDLVTFKRSAKERGNN